MLNGSPAKIAARWFQPGIFAGITMRLLCFAVIQGNPGIVAPSFQDTGFNALTTWDHVRNEAVRIENQAIQAYDSIRFAYQVAQRLKEIQERPQFPDRNGNLRRRLIERSGPQHPDRCPAGLPRLTY